MKEKGNDLDERTVSITSCGRGVLAFGKEYELSFSGAQSDVKQFMMELRQQGII